MKAEHFVIRIYASYDADLISLYAQGIPMATLAKNVLKAYAYGEELHYVLPPFEEKTVNRTCRTRITVSDEKVLSVLHKIRPRKKNLFIKELMRNALVRQNLSAFFTDNAYIAMENKINAELADKDGNILLRRGRKSLTLSEVLGTDGEKEAKPAETTVPVSTAVQEPVKEPVREPVPAAVSEPVAEPVQTPSPVVPAMPVAPVIPDEPAFGGFRDIATKEPEPVSDAKLDDDEILDMLKDMTEEF